MFFAKSVNLSLVLCLCILSYGCKNKPFVVLNDQSFEVEIADTFELRRKGLMHREKLNNDQGMLFIFDDQKPRSFWMQNTLIPLDILYFDKNLNFVSIQSNVQPCKLPDETTAAIKGIPYVRCPGYPSQGAAQYVLELIGGRTSKMNLSKNTKLELYLD